ncbi:acyltransferase family protein [Bacillus sp. FJAT-47783]|uniref:acyltransferase family protein n=1 Tax=Bacillus sp. FJAT-47783 TaxID=2922712 RepID=UPI001FAE42FD|nr:acyltransferase family protein [Bacillus sp. FJAT-47783]
MHRDSYFDNAKFILIALVVFGHLIRSFIEQNEVMLTVYKFIYTFHMPAFILIAGYFAKGFQKEGYIKKVSIKLIIPYLIFQGIYSVYYVIIQEKNMWDLVDPLNPHWSLWFLLSLFCWNLLLYPFTKLQKGFALGLAFFIGIVIGYVDFISNYLSLSRTFVFFPIFLIGFYLQKEHFSCLTKRSIKRLSILVLCITFILYFSFPFDYEWLFGSKPYSYFGETSILASVKRLGFYLLTVITTFLFLSIVPTRRTFFTDWGTRTFYVYLLHGFIIQAFRASDLEHEISFLNNLFIAAILAIVITSILSSNLIKKAVHPLIEVQRITYKNEETIAK